MDNDHSFARQENDPSLNLLFDGKSFEAFFKERFVPLCAYCQAKFKFDLDLSKEMVHTAFIKLWESRHIQSPGQSAKGYLTRIVTNNCLDTLRHQKVKGKYEREFLNNPSPGLLSEDSTPADLEQLSKLIDNSIAELPAQMRSIFELSRYDGYKYAQIAKYLGISIKTVETQMTRALLRLRQKLSAFKTVLLICIFNTIFF